MTDPNPGAPLTEDEQRSWVTAVDKISGAYLGDLTLEQMEAVVASVGALDHEWGEKVAEAIRGRWQIQRGDHLKAVLDRIKRTTPDHPGG